MKYKLILPISVAISASLSGCITMGVSPTPKATFTPVSRPTAAPLQPTLDISWDDSIPPASPTARTNPLDISMDDVSPTRPSTPSPASPRSPLSITEAQASPIQITPDARAQLATWEVRSSDRLLSRTLSRWAKEAGWNLFWEADSTDFKPSDATFTGSFKSAVSDVICALRHTDSPLSVAFYDDGRNRSVSITNFVGNSSSAKDECHE